MVQPRIAHRLITVQECVLVDRVGATQALGDVIAGHFNVESTRDRAQGVMHLEESTHFVNNIIEVARLVAVGRRDRVAVHRVGHPQHLRAGSSDAFDDGRQLLPNVAGACG